MYQLDANAAKQADQMGKFLKETGKYKGKFIKAEALVAKSGTHGISFTFETDDKRQSTFSIYTIKADGNRLYDFQKLMAIMTCMRLKNVADPVNGKAKKYDFELKKEVEYDAQLLLDLMNKPIGLLLQNCEYEKQKNGANTGEYGWKLEIFGAFEASSELTASEILTGKTKPEVLTSMINGLADRPLKNKVKSGMQPIQGYQGGTGMLDDDMSDIPF